MISSLKKYMTTINCTMITSILLAASIATHANAQGVRCESQNIIGTLEGMYEFADRVEISGTVAYIIGRMETPDSSTVTGLITVDFTEPSNPTVLGYLDNTYASDIKIQGTIAYLSSSARGLIIIDVSDPSSPVELGSQLVLTGAKHVEVEGTKAYLGYKNAVLIFDVSDPANPTQLGSFDSTLPGASLRSTITGLSVQNSIAFVTSKANNILNENNGGYEIFDVSDSSNPFILSSNTVDLDPAASYVSNSIAYMVSDYRGIQSLDISNPSTPIIMDTLEVEGLFATAIKLEGNTLYAADYYRRIYSVDVSNPSFLTILGSQSSTKLTSDFAVSNSIAFVLAGEQSVILDMSNPTTNSNIALVHDFDGFANGHHIIGNIAYVVIDEYNNTDQAVLNIYDITIPTEPILLGQHPISSNPKKIVVQDNTAYITGWDTTLTTLDVNNPSTPLLLGSYNLRAANDIVVVGSLAYIADNIGILVVDVKDPTSPQLIGSVESGFDPQFSYTSNISVRYNYVYAAAAAAGVLVFDVSQPTHPTWVGGLFLGQNFVGNDIDIKDNYAYLAAGGGGLIVLDISNPLSISKVGNYSIGDTHSYKVHVDNGVAYVGSVNLPSLSLIDVSNPTDPIGLAQHGVIDWPREIQVIGETAYCSTRNHGLEILDLSDCSNCAADFNADGSLDFFDINVFLAAFTTQDPLADFTSDGQYDFFDISAFLTAFAAGCP